MKKIKTSSLRYSLKGAFFNLREKLTGYRKEKRLFREVMGYELNLKNPVSYSEKVVWKKIHDRNPLLPVVADKYRVRQYLKDVLGAKEAEKILIPLLYVTDQPETIPFDDLPEEYIIKANHASGWNIFVEKNSPVDRKQIIAQCQRWLNTPFGLKKHEWAYQKIERKIVIEKMLREENGNVPADYKFLVFHGKCHEIQVLYERFADTSVGWYAPEWTRLNVQGKGKWQKTADYVEKPAQISSMISLVESLGRLFDFIRVDLYLVNGRIYFGELTNYPSSGRDPFDPESHDFELGSKWKVIPKYWEQGDYKNAIFDITAPVGVKTEFTLEGRGVFARRDFSEGDSIGFLNGKISKHPLRTSVQFSASLHIEPAVNNFGRYLNHSCDANAYFCGRNLYAWRPIKQGEEITIDYNCTEYALSAPFRCNCNNSDCVGEIRGFSFLADNQKEKRKGKFAKWYGWRAQPSGN